MITAGIDAGSEYLKTVVLDNDRILSWCSLPYGQESVLVIAHAGLKEALERAEIKRGMLRSVGATGSSSEQVSLADKHLLEPICCAKGATWLFKSTRTVLDLGADKCTVVSCESGLVRRIARNDKCAAGTGRYLKVIARVLQVTEEEAGYLSLQSHQPVDLEATCTVFVESEIISLIHEGRNREDILRGAFNALARRIYSLLLKVAFQPDVLLIGGMAGNVGITAALVEQIGYNLLIPHDPILVEALGAAIIAKEII